MTIRSRLNDELRYLLTDIPRESWSELPSGTARTWLAMHDSLRGGQEYLEKLGEAWSAGLIPWADFRSHMLQGLHAHLSHLHGHHRLEDLHYFPQMRAAEPRLVERFDLLNSDHHDIDAALKELQPLQTALNLAQEENENNAKLARQLLAVLDRMGGALRQHLQDEEDLVIPILARAVG